MKIFKFISVALLCSVTYTISSQSYESREGDSINPRVYIKTGVYYPNLNTSFRIDGSRLGTEIGLEDDLKLSEDLGVFRTDVIFRITEKSSIVGSYTFINRSNKLTLEEDFEFEDTVFEEGSGIEFNFDVNYVAATYRYNFFNELNWNAGLSAGLRGVFINTGAIGRVNDQTREEEASFVAPAILLGIHGSAYLTPRLLAQYSLEAFYVEISGVKINIIESNASVSWFFTKSIGAGLAYSTNNYRLTDIPLSDSFDGKVNFSFGGLNLFLVARI
jgi:hypothetical protein